MVSLQKVTLFRVKLSQKVLIVKMGLRFHFAGYCVSLSFLYFKIPGIRSRKWYLEYDTEGVLLTFRKNIQKSLSSIFPEFFFQIWFKYGFGVVLQVNVGNVIK